MCHSGNKNHISPLRKVSTGVIGQTSRWILYLEPPEVPVFQSDSFGKDHRELSSQVA